MLYKGNIFRQFFEFSNEETWIKIQNIVIMCREIRDELFVNDLRVITAFETLVKETFASK